MCICTYTYMSSITGWKAFDQLIHPQSWGLSGASKVLLWGQNDVSSVWFTHSLNWELSNWTARLGTEAIKSNAVHGDSVTWVYFTSDVWPFLNMQNSLDLWSHRAAKRRLWPSQFWSSFQVHILPGPDTIFHKRSWFAHFIHFTWGVDLWKCFFLVQVSM